MKQNRKIIIIIFAVVVFIPLLLEFVIFRNNIFSPVSNDGWAGFLGAYIGAIIGAITTFITVNLEIRNNENIRKEEVLREFKPYLYCSRVDEIDERKNVVYTFLNNFGKYAACDIKCYIVKNENRELVWDQHLCIAGNSETRIFVGILSDDEYYIYGYKDALNRKYEQIVRSCKKQIGDYFDFFSEPPVLIK